VVTGTPIRAAFAAEDVATLRITQLSHRRGRARSKSPARLLRYHGLHQVSWSIHIHTVKNRGEVCEQL
jgi:hypothetical protein